MGEKEKTKEHLLNELAEMRRRIAEFEASGTERRHTDQELLLHREQLQKLVDDRTSKSPRRRTRMITLPTHLACKLSSADSCA
jgi:hypothetical protein